MIRYGMMRRSRLLVMALAWGEQAASVQAAPQYVVQRRATLDGANMLTIQGKLPLDLILLLASTMGVAVVCALFACCNAYWWPRKQGSVARHRQQALRQLRTRGAAGTNPKYLHAASTLADSSTDDSAKPTRRSQAPPPPMSNDSRISQSRPKSIHRTVHDGRNSQAFPDGRAPRLAKDRAGRSARGYSVSSISKADIPRHSMYGAGDRPPLPSRSSMASLLALPAAQRSFSSTPSMERSLSSSSSSGDYLPRESPRTAMYSRPSTAEREAASLRVQRYDDAAAQPQQQRRHAHMPSTSSIGRGIDVAASRKTTYLKERTAKLLTPSASMGNAGFRRSFDPASETRETGHPLDLRRHRTAPEREEAMRPNSTLSLDDAIVVVEPHRQSTAQQQRNRTSEASWIDTPSMSPVLGGDQALTFAAGESFRAHSLASYEGPGIRAISTAYPDDSPPLSALPSQTLLALDDYSSEEHSTPVPAKSTPTFASSSSSSPRRSQAAPRVEASSSQRTTPQRYAREHERLLSQQPQSTDYAAERRSVANRKPAPPPSSYTKDSQSAYEAAWARQQERRKGTGSRQ